MVNDVHAREREFHDDLARRLSDGSDWTQLPDALDLALLSRAGDLAGKRVLELGCGDGRLTVALEGCQPDQIFAIDIAAEMVVLARRNAIRAQLAKEPSLIVAAVEAAPFKSGAFDLVVGKWILHHIDIGAAVPEIRRLLRPGGRAIFVENSGLNPLLAFARTHFTGRLGIPRYGTVDEHPLVHRDFDLLEQHFSEMRVDFPVFNFFHLFDRQVLRYRIRFMSRFLRTLDSWIWRHLPRLRPYSFNVLIELRA